MTSYKKRKLIIMLALLGAAAALAIASFIVLPDTLIVQVNFSGGAPSTMAKPLALALPLLLCGGFGAAYYKYDTGEAKNLLVSCVGLLVLIVEFVINM